jgi:LPXTG-motif cell wall-anchored protein
VNRPLVRRVASVAAAAIIGLVGATILASPAQAHHTVVSGEYVCDAKTGDWVVTWTVDSVAPPDVESYKFVEVRVRPADAPVDGIAVTEGDTYPHDAHEPLTGVQRVPGSEPGASLGVRAQWKNHFEEDGLKTGRVKFEGDCVQNHPTPSATLASTCDDLVVTLANAPEATAPSKFTVSVGDAVAEKVELAPGETRKLTLDKTATDVVVSVGRKIVGEGGWENPGDCGVPTLASRSTCDDLTLEVGNPTDGTPVTATFTPSSGKAKAAEVKAGETKTVSFGGTDDLKVTPNINGDEGEAIAWEQPANCAPTLPKTGASIGGAVGIAAGLLALGTAAYVLFRRRRLRFVA